MHLCREKGESNMAERPSNLRYGYSWKMISLKTYHGKHCTYQVKC